MNRLLKSSSTLALAAIVMIAVAAPAFAHCDAQDGPVIKDARVALENRDVAPVLKWIGPDDESTIRDLFAQVVTVRSAGDDAKSLADQYFFEMLVRLHREGEGASFDGIKPAGQQEPFIVRIDGALLTGEGDAVADAIAGHVRREIASRFAAAMKAAATKDASAGAGRAYVATYVDLVHFIKGVHEAVEAGGTHGHGASAHDAHGGAH
jgi:hypothetical protein